jgi:hypothetical protein
VSPASFLELLDKAAVEHEVKANELRAAANRVRHELAAAAALLGTETTPPEPLEPRRKRGRPPRGAPTSTRPNGAAGAPAPPGEDVPARRRGKRAIYPPGASERERFLIRMRREGRDDLADAIERGERSLRAGLLELGWKRPRPGEVVKVEAPADPAPDPPAPEPEPAEPGGDGHEHGEPVPPPAPAVDPEPPPAPEPAPTTPEKPKRRRTPGEVWNPSDIWSRDQDGEACKEMIPRDHELANELDRQIAAENAAVVAAEQRRRLRIESEPPPRWTEGATAEI